MRAPELRIHEDELVVDNFAGGGGASLGIEWALGRSPDIACNHDPEAVAMHEANHPRTRHFCEDVWKVDPVEACRGKRPALAWFSPDCKHFSKAKGGKPVEKKIRGLAWVVVRWARAVKPRVIMLENVEEFEEWGPLLDDGMPDPLKRGFTFRRWVGQLRAAGYVVETRVLRACDYGAPTTRKRLFLIARSDGLPIVWPKPTHGKGLTPYRTAAECITWSLPCPSIFERKRPLAEATLRRIARGIQRYVIETAEPFIVGIDHRGAGDSCAWPGSEPLTTVTAEARHALVAPSLVQTGYGEREGQSPRALDLQRPLGTVVGGGSKHALVAAFLAKHYGGHEATGSRMSRPMDTVTAVDHHSLVQTSLMLKMRGGLEAHPVTAQDWRQPAPTVTAGGTHLAEVRAFLLKYYGTDQNPQLRMPLGTVTTKDRFGLVFVRGEQYAIGDIGLRMLVPRELGRAQAFPDTYKLDVVVNGKSLTQSAQVRMIGNSVSPVMAEALARANFAAQAAVAGRVA